MSYPDNPSGGGQVSNQATLKINAVDDISVAALPRDPQGRAYVGSYALAVQADCSRGIATVSVSVNGVSMPGAFACEFSRKVTANFDVTADGSYAVAMTPLGNSGTAVGDPASITIFVKTGPPPAPTILEPSPLITTGGTVILHGTFSTVETDAIQGIQVTGAAGTTNVNLAAGTFTFSFTANPGTGYNLAFKTKDYAGNLSAAAPFTIFTNAVLASAGFMAAAPPPTVSTNELLAFTSAPVLVAPAVSAHKLYMGIPAIAGDPP